MKERYSNENVLYFDYYKIMVMFSIKIMLVSIYLKMTENVAPMNKDSTKGGCISGKNNRVLLAKGQYFEYS